jgi:hypothetical protein
MKAMTTSIRSAEWISARTWLPTRGSPGAFVRSSVASRGIKGSGIASVDTPDRHALVVADARESPVD